MNSSGAIRRVLAAHYRPERRDNGPSWLTLLGHTKDSLWSLDLFRTESILLRSHWVLVVMDQFTRRIIGFGVQAAGSIWIVCSFGLQKKAGCSNTTTTRLACTKGYPATRPGRKRAAQHLRQPALRITVGKAIATDCLNCQSPLEWQFAMHRRQKLFGLPCPGVNGNILSIT